MRLIGIVGGLAALAGGAIWVAPRLAPDPLRSAREAYSRGDWAEAAAQSGKLLRLKAADRGALRLLARADARLGRDEAARTLYSRLGEDAMQAEDYCLLGVGFFRQNQHEPALAVFQRARTLDPAHAETLNQLARLHASLNRLDEAILDAEALAKVPGWEARGNYILGMLADRHAEPARAAEALSRAIEADPGLRGVGSPGPARKVLARALLVTNQPARAVPQLQTVLSAGRDPEASWLLSRAFLQQGETAKATAALGDSGDYATSDPLRPEPSSYVGAKACAKCHKSIYRAEQNSRHARTFLDPNDLRSLAVPREPIDDPDVPGLTHRVWHEGESIRLESRKGDAEVYRAVVAYALGSGDRGLTMIGRDDAGKSRVFRMSQYGGKIWDLTLHAKPPTHDDPGSILGRHLPPDAEATCIDCHVTSFHAARDRKAIEALDRGIGCERCHGPGGNHLLAVAARFEDMAISGAYFESPEPITKMCGVCHNTEDPSVLPGDAVAVRLQSLAMPQSRCYTESEGGLSCLSCHEPHHDAETSSRYYESRCLACHSPTAPRASFLMSRTVLPEGKSPLPCPVNAESDCIRCHMPRSAAAAPHTLFTDHHIRIHRESNAK